jgi:hypothetical protein
MSSIAKEPKPAHQKAKKPPKVSERLLVPRWRWPAAHGHLVKHGGWFEAQAASNYAGAVVVRADREIAGILLQHHHAEAAPADVDTSVPPPPRAPAPPTNAAELKEIARVLAAMTHGQLPEDDA